MHSSPPKQLLTHIALLSLSALTACTPPQAMLEQPTQASTTQSASTKSKTVLHLSSWTITGAIAAKKKNKAWSASLLWQQRGATEYLIRLFGPLGGGTVILEKKGSIITYSDGKKITQSSHAEQLLAQEAGFHLPLHLLHYWIRGLAAPGTIQSSQVINGHLSTLNQAGYTLHYTAYTRVDNLVLPAKIQIDSHEGTVRLVIKHWQIQG